MPHLLCLQNQQVSQEELREQPACEAKHTETLTEFVRKNSQTKIKNKFKKINTNIQFPNKSLVFILEKSGNNIEQLLRTIV